MPSPVFSMPMFQFIETSGYSTFYERSSISVLHPVRVDTALANALDGLELVLRDVTSDSSWRRVYALTKGQVIFSYFGGEADPPGLRCVLKITLPPTTRTLRPRSSRLKQYHRDDSLASVNENFSFLRYVQYQNLDPEATKTAISSLIREAQGTPDTPEHSWVLDSAVRVQVTAEGRRRTRVSTLRNWLSSDTVDNYVNDILFNPERLSQLNSASWDPNARRTSFPLNVNVGDMIGVAARLSNGDSPVPDTYKLFLKFHSSLRISGVGYVVLNPLFFLNAVVKHAGRVSFAGEEAVPDNKLGLQQLYGLTGIASLSAPPLSVSRELNPLIWALRQDDYGLFRTSPDGQLHPDSFPNLFVFNAEPPVNHPDLSDHLIDVQARSMNVFHPHVRYPIRDGTRTGERLTGGSYQWKINDRGYLVFRTNADGAEDDWYPEVHQSDFNTVKAIWEQSGEVINKFSLIYGLPCETFVGVAGKESGGSTSSVGIEPWIPPPSPAANMPPFSARSALKSAPPEQILANYSTLPGIKYMVLTNRWNSSSGQWEPSRLSQRFPGESHVDDPIPRTGVPQELQSWFRYTWRELLTDLDWFGHTDAGEPEPEITRGEHPDKRFLRSMDGRVSPGLTQVVVREVPFEHGVRPEIVQRIQDELGSDFFLQSANPLYPSRPPANVLSRDTPPSYRFLWLRDAAHTLLSSFNLIYNRIHQLHPERCTSRSGGVCRSGYALGEHNDFIDPLFAVTVYGGMGDLTFVPSGSAFGFLAGTDSVNNQRLHRFPPKYNACVLLFDSFGLYGPGLLVPPAVRLMRGPE